MCDRPGTLHILFGWFRPALLETVPGFNMSWIIKILSFAEVHGTLLSVCWTAVLFIWSIWQFFDVRRRESENKEFRTYHRLIKELVQPEGDAGIFLDRQVAVVFELRHFKRYHELSLRILRSFKESCGSNSKFERLIKEIELTIAYLERRQSSIFD